MYDGTLMFYDLIYKRVCVGPTGELGMRCQQVGKL